MPQEVLLYTDDPNGARLEIERLGGRVTHQFTDAVLVALLPESVSASQLERSGPAAPQALDAVSLLAANAWTDRLGKSSREGDAPDATRGLRWDTPGFESPSALIEADPEVVRAWAVARDEEAESTGTPTSLYMVGSVAVGVVIVSGTQGGLAISAAEQQLILREVQDGLDFLANAEPRARITFNYDIRILTVSADPGPVAGITNPYEKYEAPWRNAALQQMAYEGSRTGSMRYVEDLRNGRGTQWAYVAYFTKYPLNHFAYAGYERLCMHYDNDGWGPNNINSVFAHETCHIFGAADEYGRCSCGGSHGYLGVPNDNCVNCTGARVPCLMDANVLKLCQWTRGQIGWDERLFPTWVKMADQTTQVAAAPLSDRRLQLWRIDDRNALWSCWQIAAESTAPWTEWSRFEGGPATKVAVAPLSDGRLQLWMIDTTGVLWSCWNTSTSSDASWTEWSRFSAGPAREIAAAPLSDGRLQLWMIDDTGALWSCWSSDSSWTSWSRFDGASAARIAAAPLSDGRLQLWMIDGRGALWSCWKSSTRPDSSWTSWYRFNGNPAREIAAAPLSDGRLQLWMIDDGGSLLSCWKTSTKPDSSWTEWTPFPCDPAGAVAAAQLSDKRLQLWVVATDGRLLSAWKQTTDSDAPWW